MERIVEEKDVGGEEGRGMKRRERRKRRGGGYGERERGVTHLDLALKFSLKS